MPGPFGKQYLLAGGFVPSLIPDVPENGLILVD